MSNRLLKCYGYYNKKYPKEVLIKYSPTGEGAGKNHCPECYQRKVKETKEREDLYNFIKTTYNLNFPTGNMLRQIKQFREERNYTYIIEWSDGSPTGCLIHSEPVEKGDFLGIARTVLIRNVNEQTHRSINNIATDIIETNKPPLGFIVQESKTTNYLINAIYYDLWDLISKNEPVYICANPNCKLPFKKVKRQKYCSNACKQEAYRIRKKQKQS